MARDFSLSPTPEEIKYARKSAGLTQTEAGKLVRAPISTWQKWEYGVNPMPFEKWRDFLKLSKRLKNAIENIYESCRSGFDEGD